MPIGHWAIATYYLYLSLLGNHVRSLLAQKGKPRPFRLTNISTQFVQHIHFHYHIGRSVNQLYPHPGPNEDAPQFLSPLHSWHYFFSVVHNEKPLRSTHSSFMRSAHTHVHRRKDRGYVPIPCPRRNSKWIYCVSFIAVIPIGGMDCRDVVDCCSNDLTPLLYLSLLCGIRSLWKRNMKAAITM